MNLQDLNTDLIKKAIAEEATPALANYWSLQYASIFDKRVSYDPELDKAFIHLLKHMTLDGKDIDHHLLQQTISVLIRFLDALTLDKKERKIRISVDEFDEFLKQTDTSEEIGIDYIGSLVADFAYRASENIAQEKGAYLTFQQDVKDLRVVEFEMWEDGKENFKSGLDLSKMYDSTSIITSPWKLIPRRNKAILDFPEEPEQWRTWSDEFDFIAKLVQQNHAVNKTKTPLDSSQPAEIDELSDTEIEKLTKDFEKIETVNQNMNSIDTLEGMVDLDNASIDEKPIAEEAKDELNSPVSELQILNEETEAQPEKTENPSVDPSIAESPNKLEFEPESTDEKANNGEVSQNLQNDNIILQDKIFNSSNDELVTGQLIKIKDSSSPFFGQIFQIIEMTPDGKYRLGGSRDNVFEDAWAANQLEDVDLYEILDLLNHKVNIITDQTNNEKTISETQPGVDFTLTKSAAMIINDSDELLLMKQSGGNWTLPQAHIAINEIPEQSILNLIDSQLSGDFKIVDEIGSVMTLHRPNDPTSLNSIYNVFLIRSDESKIIPNTFSNPALEFQYFKLKSLPTAEILVKVALDKYNHRQAIIETAKAEIRSKTQIEMNNFDPNPGSDTDSTNSHSINSTPEASTLEKTPSNLSEIYTSEELQINNQNNLNSDMSTKYVLKLQQIVSTNLFGNVAITLQYNSQGISAIQLDQAILTPELQAAVDIIITLINYMLQNSLPVIEAAELLRSNQTETTLQINQFLEIIADSLSKAPNSISNMDHSILE